jgi:chromosome partitioning protein
MHAFTRWLTIGPDFVEKTQGTIKESFARARQASTYGGFSFFLHVCKDQHAGEGKQVVMWGTPIVPGQVEERRALGQVVTVSNTKGGVGKTVFAFNTAFCLAENGLRVLVVDLDVQCGQAAFLRDPPPNADHDAGAVIMGRCGIDEARHTISPNLDVLPANEYSLAYLSRRLEYEANLAQARELIGAAFQEMRRRWDITLVDTGGHQSPLLALAMEATNGVIVPIIPEAGPVAELPTVLNMVSACAGPMQQPQVFGIARTRVWGNAIYRRVAEDQIRALASARGIRVYRNKVPEDARFGEAHLLGLPVSAHEPRARSAVAYRCLADELAQAHGWTIAERPGQWVASA